jgi:hypothetical protein
VARLRTDFWVQAYIAILGQEAIPVYVRQHGDDHAGSVQVKVCTLDGSAALYVRRYDFAADDMIWENIAQGPEADIDAHITRECARDRDIWVLEIEDSRGRHFLDKGIF